MPETETSEIRFCVNGTEHTVSKKFSATTSLNDYLREVAGLKGTKVMCREAGCGCCSVTVSCVPPDSDKLDTFSIQSCITPLYAVDGWQISTVEGIGNQKTGFHPIQERIASFNGTQCGYCTPGMVMNMYGLLHQKPNITVQEIEDNFDGNMCRCTGYRSILDAMKSFAVDANIPGAKAIDIEDLNKNICPQTGKQCTKDSHCTIDHHNRKLNIQLDGAKWCRPQSLEDLRSIFKTNNGKQIKLFFGNTASGIFKHEGPFDVYVDLHSVKELYSFEISNNSVKFGASTTLTNFMNKLKTNQEQPGLKYFPAVIRHLKFIANVMVRNAGCIAGNLMIKHAHPDFPSDIFTLLECLAAEIEVHDFSVSKSTSYSLVDFLKVNMTSKVILAVKLPKLADNELFKSFKITPRWQNAHAYVNAAFRLKVNNRVIKDRPSLVYGGINAETIHANRTEQFLTNKTLSQAVVEEALTILSEELKPEAKDLLSSPKYRQDLSVALLYKLLIEICCPDIPRLKSGSEYLHRPISSGLQTYQEMKSEWPLKKGMPKKTAPLQASGEAQFVNDIPTFQHELSSAFVLAGAAVATLEGIDDSDALKMPGVVRFLSAKDIPQNGINNYMASSGYFQFKAQELFATKDISYSGQPVGIILAETQSQANAAARKVKVNLSNIKAPILSIEESIAQSKQFSFEGKDHLLGNPDEMFKQVDKIIEGECRMGSQYHFYLETQVSLAVPSEDGIDLYAATQFSDMNQHAAAGIIGKPLNYINVTVPRLGGGFGGKAFDSCSVSTATTLAAFVTGRPVRMSLDLETNMQICGKRGPLLAKYKVGFNNDGNVQVIDLDVYLDCGHLDSNASELSHIMHYMDMGYFIPNWKIRPHPMMTNKQTMSPTRAPGSVPGAFVIETIMEHVAKSLDKHPIIVKEINLYERHQSDLTGHDMKDCTIRELWRRLKDTSEVEGRIRQVDAFNRENVWKKRGITMTTNKYGMMYFGAHSAYISIYARDGSVVVSQGGVEMGQGLYTKVAQGVAYALGVPIENIKVRPNQNLITPNSTVTGGSIASESAMQAAIAACNILKERMQPIREKFPDADWQKLCEQCVINQIDLSAKYMHLQGGGAPHFNYFTYCAAVIETEVDILTGESQIRRVDIMADFGESLNPTIDIGQVEGAFIMGVGCYLSEDIIFDNKTGRILNDGTWEYKPPTTKDIPIDWRIHLLPDTPNPIGIRSSKAVGEPPISLSVGVLLANKLAVQSARKDLFGANDFMATISPYTVERAQQSVGLTVKNLKVEAYPSQV